MNNEVLVQVEQDPLLPIPVATVKRPDPRLALTIGVAGWIAQPNDFGELHGTRCNIVCCFVKNRSSFGQGRVSWRDRRD